MKTNCSKCSQKLEENRIGKKRYCLKCSNEWMKANRKKHSQLTEEQKIKANARSYVNTYIRRGKIKKGFCEICNSENVQAHHNDYSKPLEVRWLCNKHHIEHHKSNPHA